MIRLIEALNYRCLRYVRQELGNFQVLVGPNASGKTTFLDVVGFLGDLVSEGPMAAVSHRTADFRDLVWGRSGQGFELALELEIPEEEKRRMAKGKTYDRVRYEVAIGQDELGSKVSVFSERVLLKESTDRRGPDIQRKLFPIEQAPPSTITTLQKARRTKSVVTKLRDGNDNFYVEVGKAWRHAFKLGPFKSALANLPDDEFRFPVATWLKGFLMKGVARLVLNSQAMRMPSPPYMGAAFATDGSNLPWVIHTLKQDHADSFNNWIAHLGVALPDLDTIRSIERPEDRHRYLVVRYKNKMEVPSWLVSDGTLRLLALTILAYLPGLKGIWLIEEPENGIHPTAVQTVFDSLQSVYEGQVLVATHSPVMLADAQASQVLCFSKSESGATDIVLGSEHPRLVDWKAVTNLADLFAAGILG